MWDFESIFDPGNTNIAVFIIAQIFGFAAFGFALASFHFRKKEKILQMQIIDASLYAIHFLMLGGVSACLTKILGVIRSAVAIRKKKPSYWSLNLIIVAYFLVSIATFRDGFSLLPPLTGSIYTIVLWKCEDEQKIRMTSFLLYPLWIIYDIHIVSVAGFVSHIFSFISVLIAIIMHRSKKGKKTKKVVRRNTKTISTRKK